MKEERYSTKEKAITPSKISARIILAKCPYATSKTDNLFAMRIQRFGLDWMRTWAFKIDTTKAHNEGYDKERSSGTFNPTLKYPGCPYCHSFNLAQCMCGKSFCYKTTYKDKSKSRKLTCPWCGDTGEYKTVEILSIRGGSY